MQRYFIQFLCLSIFLITACGKNGDEQVNTFFPDAPVNPDQVKLLLLVNEFRASGQSCGSESFGAVPAIVWNDTLATVARKHSQDMNANDELSHVGTNGSFVDERITAEGYVFTFYAENLLKGGATEKEAIEAWKASPVHCKNLMSDKITEMGVGTAGPYWTMVLASH